jgi:cyclase
MQQISNVIYTETGYMAPNVGFISTKEGAILVDSPFLPEDSKEWSQTITKINEKGITYLINTHCHFDHMLGNCFLTQRTIAHKNAPRGFRFYLDEKNLKRDVAMFWPEYLKSWEGRFGKVKIIIPQITFSDELNLYLGGTEVQLRFAGGHSSDSILIYIPSEKVLFAGDILENNCHPGMVSARFDPWVSILRNIEEMEVETIVPGHGEVGGRGMATRQLNYFEEMLESIKQMKTEGIKKEEVAQRMVARMLAYLPRPDEEEDYNRRLITYGVLRAFDQVD